MKKTILVLMLAIVVLAAGFSSGCANKEADVNQENTAAEQNNAVSNEEIDRYMESVKQQSDSIKYFIENEAMTQMDLNTKSMELAELWDGAMDYLMAELKNRLPDDEFSKLQNDQLAWEEKRDNAVKEAGKEFEGGSIYSFIVNSEAASITEERALELYEMLK